MRHRSRNAVLLLVAGSAPGLISFSQSAPSFTPTAKPIPDRYKQQGRYEGQVQRAKLLTRSQGWALSETQLMFTNDAGESWKEITPPTAAHEAKMVDVFFITSEQGWVLLVKDIPEDHSWSLILSTTSDQGGTWQDTPVNDIPASSSEDFGGAAYLDFVTTQRGWLMLRHSSSTAFNDGTLYGTENGGHTWQKLPHSGAYGIPHFQENGTGYLTALPSGPEGFDLNKSKDDGRTWAKLELPSLAEPNQVRSSLSDPYVNGSRITLARTIAYSNQADKVQILNSKDEGATWSIPIVFSAPLDNQAALTFAAEGGNAIHAFQNINGFLRIGDGGTVNSARLPHSWTMTVSSNVSVSSLSFPDAQTGWLLVQKWQCGLVGCTSGPFLLRTEDGGRSVQPVTIPFRTKIVWTDRQRYGALKPVVPAP